jgi:hypothetical protein
MFEYNNEYFGLNLNNVLNDALISAFNVGLFLLPVLIMYKFKKTHYFLQQVLTEDEIDNIEDSDKHDSAVIMDDIDNDTEHETDTDISSDSDSSSESNMDDNELDERIQTILNDL